MQTTDSLMLAVAQGCSAYTFAGTSELFDPSYVDAASDELRITLDSQCVDAAQAIAGNDRNGEALGEYDGRGPDIGAFERNGPGLEIAAGVDRAARRECTEPREASARRFSRRGARTLPMSGKCRQVSPDSRCRTSR
jgi:hypothetical protein